MLQICSNESQMYCINPDSDEPIFIIDSQIGADEDKPLAPYIDGNQFAKELLYMDEQGKKRIQIWISSEGGSVKEGLAIVSAMLKTKTKVDTFTGGIAYSIAGIIFLMGRKREMLDIASLMFHEAYNADGTEDKGLEIVNKQLVSAIMGRTGKTEEQIIALMKATTFYTAEEAIKEGFADEKTECGELNKPRSTSTKEVKNEFAKKYFTTALNKLNSPTNKNQMNKADICALLNLDPSVSDQFAMDALKTHLAEAKADKVALAKFTKEAPDDDEEEEDKKAKKAKAEQETEMKASAKSAITAQAKESGITLKDEEVNDFVALSSSKEGLAIILNQVKAKGVANADAMKAKAKTEIVEKLKAKGLPTSDANVEGYVALAGTQEASLKAVIATIESIPTTRKAPIMKMVNKNDPKDETGIPLLETAGTDSNGQPIAGDTSSFVQAINSYKPKYK